MSVEEGYERLLEVYEEVERAYNALSSDLERGTVPPVLRRQMRRTLESHWRHMEQLQEELSNWHADYWTREEPSPAIRRLNFEDKGHYARTA